LKTILTLTILFSSHSFAAPKRPELAIVDLSIAEKLEIPIAHTRSDLGVAVAKLSEADKLKLSKYMHENKRCGGFELIDLPKSTTLNTKLKNPYADLFKHMKPQAKKRLTVKRDGLRYDKKIADLTEEVSPQRLKDHVSWMSNYTTRHHSGSTNNNHVNDLKGRLENLIKEKSDYVKVDLINHSRTGQRTVRARIEGRSRPNEIVLLGAHFDSINQYGFLDNRAPGADDDASGSANLLEVFELLLKAERPARSVEFMWYAAEEIGLVGSSEVAQTYRQENRDVVSVLQLDMTLFPGSGELTMAYMTDFTSPELTTYFEDLNRLYVRAGVQKDRCGYGCSDHASWHRQGYAAVMPFEAAFDKMNQNIHTAKDVISQSVSFTHAAAFSKLALAYVMSVGNSEVRF
jgi:leucyl aminopeptidase